MTAGAAHTEVLRAKISSYRTELQQLHDARATGKHSEAQADERLTRWKERVVRFLRSDVSSGEADSLQQKGMSRGAVWGGSNSRVIAHMALYDDHLKALDEELVSHPDDVLVAANSNVKDVSIEAGHTPNDAVFIVHGHDEVNLLRLEKLLRERWKLAPIVLSWKPGEGRTLIEKFEAEAEKAGFAIALLTPDDLVAGEKGDRAQPRPNVTFELGWFYGRLGRKRVCILFQKGTDIHSDLHGVSRVEFVRSVDEAVVALERELKQAGLL